MRSVRIDDELESRLERASEASGEPISEIIRKGARRQCDEILRGSGTLELLGDVVGAVRSSGGRDARNHKAEYAALMKKRHGNRRSSKRRRS